MNALQLAYLGDVVWETIIRYDLVLMKLNVRHLHSQCVKHVNAGAQSEILTWIAEILTERETEIVRRGRNAHPKHTIPKNQQADHYAASTGLEALFGYLYLSGQDKRIERIVQIIKERECQHG